MILDPVPLRCQLLADALLRNKYCQVSTASSANEMFQALESSAFNVLLAGTDFSRDQTESFQLVRGVKNIHPETSVVVMLDALERETVVEAFRSGAQGVFHRSDSLQNLGKCVLRVFEGQVWANARELNYMVQALAEPGPLTTSEPASTRPLSKREEQIAVLVAEGLSNRQISQRLNLSEHTIKNYLFRVFEKLGVSTRVELTLYALKRGDVPRTRRPAGSVAATKAEFRDNSNLE